MAGYQNAAGVQSVLSNTFMAGNYTDTDGAVRSYADTFVEIGSNVGVSPYHLASRCKQGRACGGRAIDFGTIFPTMRAIITTLTSVRLRRAARRRL